jgi:5-methylcytosine-specific restriction enzyme A
MVRPLKVCAEPGCPALTGTGRCPEHTRPAWSTSTRKQRVGLSGYAEQQRSGEIIRRDRGICHVCGNPGADQADHIVALGEGGPDSPENMAAIHARPCHQRKTAAESARARTRNR